MTKTAYYPPEYEKKEFNCAHCKVFAHQTWISNLRGELVNVMTLNLLAVRFICRIKMYTLL